MKNKPKRLAVIKHFPLDGYLQDEKTGKYLFQFTVYHDPSRKKPYIVILSKVEGAPTISKPLSCQTSLNQAIRWIHKFKRWDYERQIEFISKKDIQAYLPKNDYWVFVTVAKDEFRTITQKIPKSILIRDCDTSLKDFDGIKRVQDLIGCETLPDKRIRLKSSRAVVQNRLELNRKQSLKGSKHLRLQDRNKKFQKL